MTPTQAVKSEIERFLRTTEPEVLCVTGSWGVGKTYTWQTILDRIRGKRETGLSRYSYVSLFGIDSLEAMKTAIFENLEFLLPEGSTALERFLSGGNTIVKGSKKLASVAAALPIPYLGGALSRAQPLLFSAIRNQIVCIDDLERRGALSVKDVFGLVSYLREQRACKVVLLLNRTQLDDTGQEQFDSFFEKVIDAHLVFAPSSSEALAIAISESDDLSTLIRAHCEKLDISNIRVIKKIERLVRMLNAPVLTKFTLEVMRQVVHSMVMFGWRKLDVGAKPPPISYLQKGELERYMLDRGEHDEEGEAGNADRQRWDVILANYGWGSMDDLDIALLNFVETSILDTDEISARAKDIEASLSQRKQMTALEQCWRPFHDGFQDNEDEVCKSIVRSIKDNFAIVSRPNLDAAVLILEELGRTDDAESLIDFAQEKGANEFWVSDDPFHRAVKDTRIRRLVDERRMVTQSPFDFEKDLLSAAQSMNGEKLALLAAVPVEQYERLFESTTGDALSSYIYAALEYRKIGNTTDDMKKVVTKAEEALRRIAGKSKLNEIRVRKYDVTLDSSKNKAIGRIEPKV